jgi:hypothetical protein
MSSAAPLFEPEVVTTWRFRGGQPGVGFQALPAGYYALAATCVANNDQRAHRRSSLTDDRQKIARAVRLLIYLDSR